MAVQAQYPSNVLLLNRNGQEMRNNNNNTPGNEYSLQTQTGGLLDHQSQMFFNNNNGNGGGVIGVNPRKRGRETAYGMGGNGGNGGGSVTTTTTPINLFSLQPQAPSQTLINLSQLHHQQQPNLVSTGLRLAFSEQQQQDILLSSSSSSLSSILSEDLTSQIKLQRDEIDQLLQLQGDELRRTLAERRATHYNTLLGVAEATAARRLREKETEIQKATRRNAELEERVAQLRLEAQVWQNKARTQELTATSLQIQLQQAMMANAAAQQQQEEGVGCSGGNDDAESAHVDPERSNTLPFSAAPVCKACRGRSATVVLLPCRHLSLCTDCNASVDTCPLCRTLTTSSVEVYLS